MRLFSYFRCMERRHIIVLTKGDQVETWGSLTELCSAHGFPYHSLKDKRFPFSFGEYRFYKTEYRSKTID